MKKKIVFVALFAIIVGFCTPVQAQTDTNINPLNVARAFALKTPASFQCQMAGEMLVSNSWQWMNMSFTMRGDFAITNLSVNGNQIALPEPIYGIPMGDAGLMRNVYLNMNAMTKSGEYAGSGYLYQQMVSKDDNLKVVISPAEIRQEIPIDVSQYGNDLDLTIEGYDYGYGWGVSDGKFYVYMSPVGGSYQYILRRRSDGMVIGTGWLEPFHSVNTPGNAYVGFSYVGNVQGVEFTQPAGTESWAEIRYVQFDCSVPMYGGSNVLGKVIFADVGPGALEIVLNGEYDIYVQDATSDNGDMPFLPLEDNSTSGQYWSQTRVNTLSQNVGKVVVTIIPKPSNNVSGPWVGFHRFYGHIQGFVSHKFLR